MLSAMQAFGFYEIIKGSSTRTQKATVSRQDTVVYALNKNVRKEGSDSSTHVCLPACLSSQLLVDMLRTHKISDNITRQERQKGSFHVSREEEILKQSRKNSEMTSSIASHYTQPSTFSRLSSPPSLLLQSNQLSPAVNASSSSPPP